MPSMIYTGTKSIKKQKKKSGWKQQEEEYKAWLAKHQPTKEDLARLVKAKKALSQKSTTSSSKLQVSAKSASSGLISAGCSHRFQQTNSSFGQEQPVKVKSSSPSSKEEPKIHDPRLLYRDNPEMLERELKARERKFTVAPVYNKGADQFITDEMMKDIMSGSTRRRG